jgi:hypothetical protein
VRVATVAKNKDCTFVCGLFQTGEYGFTSQLVDSQSNSVSHERGITEAEMIPFFFCFSVPMQGTWGVLLLQRFKNLGIRDFLVPDLVEAFNKAHGNQKLMIDRLVPSTFVNALLDNSTLKGMRFVRYEMPQGIEDAFEPHGFKEHVSELELIVKAKRDDALPMIATIKQVILGKKNLSEIITIPSWEYDAVKLDLEFGGRRRTVDVGKPNKVSANLDITEDVKAGGDGHPLWEEIVPASAEFASDILSTQGVTIAIDETLDTISIAEKLTGDLQVKTA